MKLRFRDTETETDDEPLAEVVERRTLPLPKRKHSDYPPPKVYGWEPSDWIKPPREEQLRARR